MGRKVTFSLNPNSIGKAIEDVGVYREHLEAKRHLLMDVIVARGVQIAKEELEELVYSLPGEQYRTRDLINSLQGKYYPETGTGVIWTDNPYAIFVEFGTGVVGGGEPHPEAGEHGWQYGDKGWVYYNDRVDRHLFTFGYRSRPFMYNTVKRLEAEVPKIVKEVFG